MTIIGAGGTTHQLALLQLVMSGQTKEGSMESWMARYTTRLSRAWRKHDDEGSEWAEMEHKQHLRATEKPHIGRSGGKQGTPTGKGNKRQRGRDEM